MHSEMHPVWQNPIQRAVTTAHLSVLMIVHNCRIQYSTEQLWLSPLLPPEKHHSSDVAYQRRGVNQQSGCKRQIYMWLLSGGGGRWRTSLLLPTGADNPSYATGSVSCLLKQILISCDSEFYRGRSVGYGKCGILHFGGNNATNGEATR